MRQEPNWSEIYMLSLIQWQEDQIVWSRERLRKREYNPLNWNWNPFAHTEWDLTLSSKRRKIILIAASLLSVIMGIYFSLGGQWLDIAITAPIEFVFVRNVFIQLKNVRRLNRVIDSKDTKRLILCIVNLVWSIPQWYLQAGWVVGAFSGLEFLSFSVILGVFTFYYLVVTLEH